MVKRAAGALLSSIRSDALHHGVRGQAPGNRRALINTMIAFSRLCLALEDALSQIDINPVIVNPHQVVAADALAVIRSRVA